MTTELKRAKALFLQCFSESEETADIILGYACAHGEVHFAEVENTDAGMLCLAPLGNNGMKYLFAACTLQKYRGRGIFTSNLRASRGEGGIALIPENASLYDFYARFGFREVLCLEAEAECEKRESVYTGSAEKLFEIYCGSRLEPKKDFFLFEAALRAHIAYGGSVFCAGDRYALVSGDTICEVCAPSEKEMLDYALRVASGQKKLMLPSELESTLSEKRIGFRRIKCGMTDDSDNGLWLNILFN